MQVYEGTEPGPQHEVMIAEDQNTSSQRPDAKTMQVNDEDHLQLVTIMQETDEGHYLHVMTEALRRGLLDQLLPHVDLKQQRSRKIGTSRGTTSTQTRAMG